MSFSAAAAGNFQFFPSLGGGCQKALRQSAAAAGKGGGQKSSIFPTLEMLQNESILVVYKYFDIGLLRSRRFCGQKLNECQNFLTECRGPPQEHQKNLFSNFDLKLCREIGLNESSLL
jgi:hypothetical protein